jgi:hypothetical protein
MGALPCPIEVFTDMREQYSVSVSTVIEVQQLHTMLKYFK